MINRIQGTTQFPFSKGYFAFINPPSAAADQSGEKRTYAVTGFSPTFFLYANEIWNA